MYFIDKDNDEKNINILDFKQSEKAGSFVMFIYFLSINKFLTRSQGGALVLVLY